jgi:hypothetical protein
MMTILTRIEPPSGRHRVSAITDMVKNVYNFLTVPDSDKNERLDQ